MSQEHFEQLGEKFWTTIVEGIFNLHPPIKDPNKLDNVVLDYYRRIHELKQWRLPDLDWRGQK